MDLKEFYFQNIKESEYHYRFLESVKKVNYTYNIFCGEEETQNYQFEIYDVEEAITKFTFLLSVPVICGATVLKVTDLALTKEVIVGIISSFAMGVIAIKFLLNYIKKHDFSVFAFYRVILALVVFIKLIFFK